MWAVTEDGNAVNLHRATVAVAQEVPASSGTWKIQVSVDLIDDSATAYDTYLKGSWSSQSAAQAAIRGLVNAVDAG